MQSIEGSSPSEPDEGVNGLEVLRWFDAVFQELLSTTWGPLLRHRDVEILESLRCELFYSTVSLLRRNYAALAGRGGFGRLVDTAMLWAHERKLDLLRKKASRASAPLQHVDILFWPCEPTHIKAARPVYEWLEHEQGVSQLAFACKPRVHQELLSAGIQTVFPDKFWGDEIKDALRQGRVQAAKLMAADSIDMSGLTPFDKTEVLVENLRVEAAKMMPPVFMATCNAENVLKRIQPRLLVVGNDFTYEGRVGCQVACAKGVPTGCQMHGILANNPLHSSHIVDRFLVYGDSSRRNLLELGLRENQITVVGAPYLDSHVKQSGKIDQAVQENLKLDPSRPYVLAANSGPGNTISFQHHELVLDAMFRASAALPEVQFVAKLHRKDRAEFYEQAKKSVPGARLQYITNGAEGYPGNIFNWLQGCNLLLTGASAVAVEAMLMEIPVITMDFANEISRADFVDTGTSTHVTEPAELIEAIRELVESPERRAEALSRSQEFLRDMFLKVDGNSARRAGEEYCRLAGKEAVLGER